MSAPACSGLPIEDFFEFPVIAEPDEPWSAAGPDFERIQQVCLSCPVRAACLAAGIRESYGVWGGLAPKERKRLRRKLGTKELLRRVQVPQEV